MEWILLKGIAVVLVVMFGLAVFMNLMCLHFAWKHRNEQWFKDASRKLRMATHRR